MTNETTDLLYVPEVGDVTSSHIQLVMDYKLCGRSLQFITYNKITSFLDKMEVDLNGEYEITGLDCHDSKQMSKYRWIHCNPDMIRDSGSVYLTWLPVVYGDIVNIIGAPNPVRLRDPNTYEISKIYNMASTTEDFIEYTVPEALCSLLESVSHKNITTVVVIINEDLIANKELCFVLRTFSYFFNREYARKLYYLAAIKIIDDYSKEALVFDHIDHDDLDNLKRFKLKPYGLTVVSDEPDEQMMFCDLTGNDALVNKLKEFGCKVTASVSNALKNVIYHTPDVFDLFKVEHTLEEHGKIKNIMNENKSDSPYLSNLKVCTDTLRAVVNNDPLRTEVISEINKFIDENMDLEPAQLSALIMSQLYFAMLIKSDGNDDKILPRFTVEDEGSCNE